MVVYIASLWHQYCDPFTTLYARTSKLAQEKVNESYEYERNLMLNECDCQECEHESLCDSDECECEECCEDDIMGNGITQEDMSAAELKKALGYKLEGELRYRELIELGYAYSGW